MKLIATIVPTYKRASRLPALIENHKSNFATLYFVVTPDDLESQECLKRLGQNFFIYDAEYTQSVNYAVTQTREPFILCASDDVVFQPGWDVELVNMAMNDNYNIFGGTDEWPISKTMLHISHPMVRRSYIKDTLYHTEYIHYMNDIELVQRGLKENCVMITPRTLIEHPMTEEEKRDATYTRSLTNLKHDKDIYNRRK